MNDSDASIDMLNRLRGLNDRSRKNRPESATSEQEQTTKPAPDEDAREPSVFVGANDVRGFIDASRYNAQESRRDVKQKMNVFGGATVFKPVDEAPNESGHDTGAPHSQKTPPVQTPLSDTEVGPEQANAQIENESAPVEQHADAPQPLSADPASDALPEQDDPSQLVQSNHSASPDTTNDTTSDMTDASDIATAAPGDIDTQPDLQRAAEDATSNESVEIDYESSSSRDDDIKDHLVQETDPLPELPSHETASESNSIDTSDQSEVEYEEMDSNYQPIFDPLTNKISEETNRATDDLLQELAKPAPTADIEPKGEDAPQTSEADYQSQPAADEPIQQSSIETTIADEAIESPAADTEEAITTSPTESNAGSVGSDIEPIDDVPDESSDFSDQQDVYYDDDTDESYMMMPPEDVAEIMDGAHTIQPDSVPQQLDDATGEPDDDLDDYPDDISQDLDEQAASPQPDDTSQTDAADTSKDQDNIRMQASQARALASVFNNIGKLVHGLPQAEEDKVQAAARFIREAELIKVGLNQVFLAKAPEEIPPWLRAQISTIAIELAVSSRTEVGELIEISKMLAQSTLVEPDDSAPLRHADIAIKAVMVRALSEIYLQLEDACELLASKGAKDVSDYLYDNRSELLVKIQSFYMRSLDNAKQMLGISDMSETGQFQVLSTVLSHIHQLHVKHLAKDLVSLTLNAGGGMSPARLFASGKHTMRRIMGGEGQDKVASQVATILALVEESVNTDIAQIIESTQQGNK